MRIIFLAVSFLLYPLSLECVLCLCCCCWICHFRHSRQLKLIFMIIFMQNQFKWFMKKLRNGVQPFELYVVLFYWNVIRNCLNLCILPILFKLPQFPIFCAKTSSNFMCLHECNRFGAVIGSAVKYMKFFDFISFGWS